MFLPTAPGLALETGHGAVCAAILLHAKGKLECGRKLIPELLEAGKGLECSLHAPTAPEGMPLFWVPEAQGQDVPAVSAV